MEETIRIHQLSKHYRGSDRYALKDLSLSINRNEVFGLLGPNGAGKTTLISILCGMIAPTSGEWWLNGLSHRKNRRKIQQQIGIVPQEYALYPTLSAEENLYYFGSLYGLSSLDLRQRIREGLHRVGLADFAHKPIKTFSGGMQRRVNLLAGILHRPNVLFLDEPTVGVDVQSKEVIMALLHELNAQGTTIIYSSHHLNEAQHFCTRIAIIDDGRIVVEGKPQQLIASVAGATSLENVFIHLTGSQLRDYA
ncbi:ABC transporter ATP-binding protein [Parapedobacter sp. ISTM3]|uniref:ABC-2 type transport system ATP-binding protein n=1 Tax=Parapedobacter luteus TaxID=623280 RepID=A0A1T5DUS8_9SPHI|nr:MULTISPECIES: ABC transporter ATP-binding protein [Parapedobacter]MBK1440803.1 ABC transporter ATP-binding protein [Parapedobacter sp. ISTM3]SKB75163.1 ABC-2 type transport system ATP-binding protein [Parapedobacter luteus]